MAKKKRTRARSRLDQRQPLNSDEILSPMSSADILGDSGQFKKIVPGFIPREPQQKMAEAIDMALKLNDSLIVEAGTGTGKTFGYLVPIFLSQKKTIISTGTKNLQDQLFFNDIPVMKKVFPFPIKVALLKGRANYLCRYRLDRHLKDGRFYSRQEAQQLHRVEEWSRATRTGDLAEVTTVPEDSTVWSQVISHADNCLGQECVFYKDCFIVKARQQAMGADILVVNHHLFFADMVLQDQEFGELLPNAEAVIFDEAHHLPEIASQFFSTSLTSRQIIELTRDTKAEMSKDAKDMTDLLDQADNLQKCVQDMRAALGMELRRAVWPDSPERTLRESVREVLSSLGAFEDTLKKAAVRGKGLENCWHRAAQFLELLSSLTTADQSDNTVRWFETYPQNFSLQATPIVIAEQFNHYMKSLKRSWIFTSATLTANHHFTLFTDALGLGSTRQLQLKSSFDYQQQSLLYVPRGLPDPRSSDYTAAVVEAALPVVTAARGRTFILFTSHKALDYAAQRLKDEITFPLLLQGSMSKRKLIEAFKTSGQAVLLGTSSFWYGVDVPGDALSCVIIDKLPFTAPQDPILQARISLLRKQGIDPFQAYQLPHAVIVLKQGAGRLIRGHQDRGVLMICDPRLVGSAYGAVFLQSLPAMPRTRDFEKVSAFYETTRV
jgi:ATP-dependent DNA helicase DinG